MKKAKPTYVDPYEYRRSEAVDNLEWGLIDEQEFERQMLMVDMLQQYRIQPYSDREMRNFEMYGGLVQPAKTMCVIVGQEVAA